MILILRISLLRFAIYLLAGYALISNCAGLAVVEREGRRSTEVAPLSITPSQDWDGNDGLWSSFSLQIGTPPQPVKVLISTASSQTWAVAVEGCQSGDPSNCAQLRGGEYDHTLSSTWVTNEKNSSTNIYALGLESGLGYNGSDYRGRYGFDDITLGFAGSSGPTLANQTIAEIAVKPFFMGYFGLNPATSNFSDNDSPVQSYLYNLRNQSKIPSLSWAYTAGNQYRLKNTLGSLTLGGYDSSKFTPNDLSFNFSQADNGYLGVVLNSLEYGDTNLLPDGPITTFLDSTLPYIYLPLSACAVFESTFGLIWNSSMELYTVNTTQHVLLTSDNPSITFTLSIPNITNSDTINITFPYAAFDLTATWPLASPSARFFPLRRANDSSQYVLGRAFFQEAYVIADFERGNFSVSACKWDQQPQHLVTIFPLNSPNTNKPVLSTGAIAGIAAGGALILIILAAAIFYRRRKQKQKAMELGNTEVGTNTISSPGADNWIKPELPGNSVAYSELPVKDASQMHEVDAGGDKIAHGGVLRPELDGRGLQPIYELPVNEEVAIELTANNETRNLTDKRENRRSGGLASWAWLRGKGNPRRADSTSKSHGSRSRSESLSSGWRSATPQTGSTTAANTPEPRYTNLAQDIAHENLHEHEIPIEVTPQTYRTPTRMREVERSPEGDDPGSGTLSSMSSPWGGTHRSRDLGDFDLVSPQTPPSAGRRGYGHIGGNVGGEGGSGAGGGGGLDGYLR